MKPDTSKTRPDMDRHELRQQTVAYQSPAPWKSIWQLANTLIPYGVLSYVGYVTIAYSFWLTLPVILLLAGFMVRTFIIFHDCGHRSFFRSRKANDICGMITGILTFTPYHHWRTNHARHHGTSGNLDKRGQGDVWMMTRTEYLEAPWKERIKYRLYRNPLVMFLLGPLAIILLNNRVAGRDASRKDRISIYGTNLAVVLVTAGIIVIAGWQSFVLVHMPALFVAHVAGVWLFYVQHQFEGVYWTRDSEWDFVAASLEGGSFYKLPAVMRWFSGSIGYHHLHHLNSRIPNYNLVKCERSIPALKQVKPVNIRSSLGALTFRVWDEDARRLIGLRNVRRPGFNSET